MECPIPSSQENSLQRSASGLVDQAEVPGEVLIGESLWGPAALRDHLTFRGNLEGYRKINDGSPFLCTLRKS